MFSDYDYLVLALISFFFLVVLNFTANIHVTSIISDVYKRENSTVCSNVQGHFKTENGTRSAKERINNPWCS